MGFHPIELVVIAVIVLALLGPRLFNRLLATRVRV